LCIKFVLRFVTPQDRLAAPDVQLNCEAP